MSDKKTRCGNSIVRGFSWAGSDGSELNLFSDLCSKGYDEFYYSAPYHWGVVNVKERKIFSYTEGDTALISCDDDESFKKELMSHWNYYKESNPRLFDGDSVETMKKAGLEVSVDEF